MSEERRTATKAEFDHQMERLVAHYHPIRDPADFNDWADEIRRAFGTTPYAVLTRACSLWKLNQEKLPIISLFTEYVNEASKQVQAENALRLPPPPKYDGGRKPPDAELEWAFCTGAAKMELVRQGRIGELPTDADIQAVWDERRERNIPVGSMKVSIGKVPPRWKETEEIVRARRLAGTLTPRLEDYLRDRDEDTSWNG